MVPVRLGQPEPSRLPRIVWTDLVFRVPWHKAQSTALSKETERCEQNMAATSKLHPESVRCRLGKKNGKMKPPYLCLRGIPEGDVKHRNESTPPKSPTVNQPLSTPGRVTAPEKCAIKKILVDLRPILENITDPFASGQEDMLKKDPQESGCSSPTTGGSRDEGLIEGGEDRTTKMATVEEGGGGSRDEGLIEGEDRTTKTATVEGGGSHTQEMATVRSQEEDISWPPTADPFRASDSDAKTPKGTKSQPGESTPLRKNSSPAVLTLQPPSFFSKITPQQWVLLETDNSREPLAPPSPDFQLPTQLLLQRLQETTNSTQHLLITQVLSSLREELLVASPRSGDGEKRDTSPEVPQTKTRKSKATDGRRKEPNVGLEATKRRLKKFTWIRDRPLYGTGGEESAPDPQTATGLRDKNLPGLGPSH